MANADGKGWDGVSPVCTVTRCKAKVPYGQGAQVVRENGVLERLCERHWLEECRTQEATRA